MDKPTDTERRAEVVKALREMADLLESSPWLPVPFSGHLQAQAASYGQSQAERFAALRTIAQRMGVNVVEHDSGSREAARAFGPFKYFVHENADTYPARGADRIVPAEEDAALIAA